jgi:hypothetical protein
MLPLPPKIKAAMCGADDLREIGGGVITLLRFRSLCQQHRQFRSAASLVGVSRFAFQ